MSLRSIEGGKRAALVIGFHRYYDDMPFALGYVGMTPRNVNDMKTFFAATRQSLTKPDNLFISSITYKCNFAFPVDMNNGRGAVNMARLCMVANDDGYGFIDDGLKISDAGYVSYLEVSATEFRLHFEADEEVCTTVWVPQSALDLY